MFKNTQFKKGDTVSLKSDLTTQLTVEKVWIEESNRYVGIFIEKLALGNGTVVTSNDINYYSYPVNKLANENKELNKKIESLTKTIEDNRKVLDEVKDKVIKKDKSGLFYVYGLAWSNMLGVENKPEPKTLEERIEELEAKLTKKVKTPKVKKNKSKKSKK